ncbi:MAG: tetratricopeptide repeat protein [Candidatus Natronoplasma sp.]
MTEKLFGKLDERDLLLIHLGDLSDKPKQNNGKVDPVEDILGIEKEMIKRSISELEEKGMIIEEKTHSDQDEILRYELTEGGKKEKERIWDDIKENKIILIDEKDAVQLKLENVPTVLDGVHLIEIIKNIDGRGVLYLRDDEKSREELVGREEHIKKLKDLITGIDHKEINTLLISGDTGMGKTMLVEELKNMVLEMGFDFLKGRCFIEDQAPYSPFNRALKKLLEIKRGTGEAQGVISQSRSSRGKAESQKMFDTQRKSVFYGTTKFLRSLSEFRPLVIFLDDIQWADSGTLNLLDYMADRLRDEAVILIGAYRPGDVSESDPLKRTMRRMSRKKLYHEIELGPLGEESIEKMISEITGIDKIPDDFVRKLEDKTNGNPLFVKEIVNQMLKERLIDTEKGELPTESEIIYIPDVVQEVIENRVFDLNDESREILQLGSVIGKDIPFELLANASDEKELELLDKIDPLLENNIWEEDPREDVFSFSHNLFLDTIYEGVGKWLERKNLHIKIAEATEKVYEGGLDDRYFTLGHHFKKGEDYEKAFDYFMKAGEKAEKVYAHEDAIERYEEALMIANRTGEIEKEEKISLLEELGEINNIIGDYEKSRKYLRQPLAEISDPERKRRLYRNIIDSWYNEGKFDKVIEITDEALDLGEKDHLDLDEMSASSRKENTREICKLLSKKAWALMRKGEYERAKEIFFEELNRAEELGDRTVLAQAYHDLGSLERGGLSTEDCIRYLTKAIKIRKDILAEEESFKEKYDLFRSYNNLGAIYFERLDLDKSLSLFEKALKLNQEIKNKMFEVLALNNIAAIKSKKGELDGSKNILEEVLEMAEGIHYTQGQLLAENTLGVINQERGKFDLALEHFKRAKDITEKMDFKYGMIDVCVNISQSYIFKGEMDKAKDHLDQGHKLAEEIKNERSIAKTLRLKGNIERLEGSIEKSIESHKKALETDIKGAYLFWNRCELVEDFLAKEDIKKAEENLEKAKEENIGTEELDSKLKMLQGVLLREKGDLEKSKKFLETSLEMSKDLSKRYRIARVDHELGKLYISMDNDEKAREYLDTAKQLFEQMGMKLRLKETREVLRSLD